MCKISRSGRAQIQRRAKQIRQQGQRAGWDVARAAAAILSELPDVRPLEAWRLAYGWGRRQVIDGIAALYGQAGLPIPAINASMLCRWEHGEALPGIEYSQALCRLYGVRPDQLGLETQVGSGPLPGESATTGHQDDDRESEHDAHALAAVRESIQFALEVEGWGGGSLVRDQLEQAVQYYALNYAALPPGLLTGEVHRCRAVVAGLLRQAQPAVNRRELRLLGGWLSALLGNLAFHCADHTAAAIHLRAAAGLADDVGHDRLVAWALAAQSMLARCQNRPADALDLARRAAGHVNTPLRRAQVISWAEVPALASLGRRDEARDSIAAALREMDAAPERHEAGRFGFDPAELELHVAEAELMLGDAKAATVHAQASLDHTSRGRPSWAAATLALARSEAQRHRPDQGAELALHVLDVIPTSMLRQTSRQRLVELDDYLTRLGTTDPAVADLHERLRALPPSIC